MATTPESLAKMATTPEIPAKMATMHVSRPVMAANPEHVHILATRLETLYTMTAVPESLSVGQSSSDTSHHVDHAQSH